MIILVDVEGGPFAGEGMMREFGAVAFTEPPFKYRFHGRDDSVESMEAFQKWLRGLSRTVFFVSDNPAFDWQHINWAFHTRLGSNPFGHSGRRIGDFYAGLKGNWRNTQEWKRLRRTPHDHNPVNDALGNAEALWEIMEVTTARTHQNASLSEVDLVRQDQPLSVEVTHAT